jgi:hypothetical protein
MTTKVRKTHKEYAGTDKLFITACTLAETPATKRQAAKWRQCRGKAWAKREEAVRRHAERGK